MLSSTSCVLCSPFGRHCRRNCARDKSLIVEQGISPAKLCLDPVISTGKPARTIYLRFALPGVSVPFMQSLLSPPAWCVQLQEWSPRHNRDLRGELRDPLALKWSSLQACSPIRSVSMGGSHDPVQRSETRHVSAPRQSLALLC